MAYLPQPPSHLLACSAAGLLTYALLVVVYRIYFHPLSEYPGPLLAKITSLYAAYHGYAGDIHLNVLACHLRYGNFVRYGPNRLSIFTSTGTHEIYGHKSNVKKAQFYTRFHLNQATSVLSAKDKDEHSPRRKLLNAAFSEASLRQYEPTIVRLTGIFIQKMVDDQIEYGTYEASEKTGPKWSGGRNMARCCM